MTSIRVSDQITDINQLREELDALRKIATNSLGVAQNSFLVSGGHVVWETGYNFRVSAASFYIDGVLYSSAEQTVTLSASDPTDDRIDVIYVDTSGVVGDITGAAADNPIQPDIDVNTQLALTFILVTAASTSPTYISNTNVYLENTEWTTSVSGGTVNANSTNNPRTGTKCVEATAAASGAYVDFATPAGFVIPTTGYLVLYIRSKGSWGNKSVRIRFMGTILSSANGRKDQVFVDDGLYTFVSTNTSAYQQIAVPVGDFLAGAGATATSLRIEVQGGGSNIGFYIDDIVFQDGLNQESAQPVVVTRSIGVSLDGGGSAIEAGTAATLFVPFACTIKTATLTADQSGAIVIDVQKDTYANYPPTGGDSICAAAKPTLSGVIKSRDTTLTGWTKAIAAGDTLRFVVDSATSVERVTLVIEVVSTH